MTIDIAGKFYDELRDKAGYGEFQAREIADALGIMIGRDFPEIAAINEMRGQIQATSWQERIGQKFASIPKYSKRQHGGDPVAFFKEQYADLLRDGNVTAGQVQRYDSYLSVSLYRALTEAAGTGSRMSITDLIEAESGQEIRASPFKRRLRACATILGTTETEAARFLTNIRPDRTASRTIA